MMSEPRQLTEEDVATIYQRAFAQVMREEENSETPERINVVLANAHKAGLRAVSSVALDRGRKEERERENEECAKLVDDWIAKYPAEMFQRPEDAMLREVLRNVAEDIRCRINERTEL